MKSHIETQVILQMFEGAATHEEVNKIIFEVNQFKRRLGLYLDVCGLGPDLHLLKCRIQEKTGLNNSAAGILATQLWHIEKSTTGRIQRQSQGIKYATLISADFLCPYKEHWVFNQKKFCIKTGVKLGFFRRYHPGELFGCGCTSKPILPF
ncbi:hypothetical protein [Aeromonas jandaei]